jgi:RNA polymerase sigma factor (sigma-70 family)
VDRRRPTTRRANTSLEGPVEEFELEDEHAPGPQALEVGEESARARAALALLPEGHRWVFELAVLGGRPYPEIAELLGIPIGTVKSRVFHAVRKLRELLEAPDESGGAT